MKHFALAAIVALAAAAPALAQTQLERSVGAAPGQYTLNQLVQLKDRQDASGNEAAWYFDPETTRFSTSGTHNATAQRILQQLADESRGDRS